MSLNCCAMTGVKSQGNVEESFKRDKSREKQKNQAILHGAKVSETSHGWSRNWGKAMTSGFSKDKRRSMVWVKSHKYYDQIQFKLNIVLIYGLINMSLTK